MRLTLRTLLAWLDDTLQPSQVREIGIQVASSPFTQELIDRIHRVSRQRRLSVPRSSGPEATDPNLVASYLDNDLDPDEVAEFEKKCLTSDVNLAEVASVHQILSLLGQKVKVPAEARARMYQLVRGREAMRPKRSAGSRSRVAEPVTTPIQPWVVPELPRRSWIERFGPALACLVLLGLSSWLAWRSLMMPTQTFSPPLDPSSVTRERAVTLGPQQEQGVRKDDGENGPDRIALGGQEDAALAGGAAGGNNAAKPDEAVDAKGVKTADAESKRKEPAPMAPVPAGSAGMVSAPDGIVLRFNNENRLWDRLSGPTPVATGERILCLAPFQASLMMGKMQMILMGGTEVRVLPQSTDAAPALELMQGRLLLKQHPTGSLKVGVGDRIATLEIPAESGIALERLVRLEYGRLMTPTAPLVIFCTQGEVSAAIDRKQESLTALDSLSINASQVKRASEESLPAWMTDAEPAAAEVKSGEQFARAIHPSRPVVTEIVGATEDKNPEVRMWSIIALKSLGDMSYLMPLISKKGDPLVRRAAIAAVRAYLAFGPEAAGQVREQIVVAFGDDTAAFVGKMLIGFTPEEAANPQLYEQLVEMLSPAQDSVGVRELALESLKRLTGRRDDLGYDPDEPEGKGFNAWKDLQRQGKLKAASGRTQPQ